MNYPTRLLPQSNYKKIQWTNELSSFFLIRHTPTKDLLIPNTNQLNPDNLKIQSDHLKDLSTNLFGEFLVQDIKIDIIDKTKGFYDLWNEGEEIIVPVFNSDFCLRDGRGYFFLNIGELVSTKITHTDGVEGDIYNLSFRLMHTPTRCNFWHFSIRVFADDDIEVSTLSVRNNLKKSIWRTAKEHLIKCSTIIPPTSRKLNAQYYTLQVL